MFKKNQEPNTSPIDTDAGTAADVDAVMKKYDRESNVRIFEGIPKQIVRYVLVAFSLFMFYMNLIPTWDERVRCSLFVGMVVMLVFLVYPMRKGSSKVNFIPWYDWLFALAGAVSFFHFTYNYKSIVNRGIMISDLEIWLGVLGIIVLFEACRRVVGLPILVVAGSFIGYAFISGQSLRMVIYNLFYTTTGVIGTPISVCCTYIVLFIIFGAFLEVTGIANFFIQCANAIAGASAGGPAKVAVISSALCGMVSGSSVGNTVTTGSVTIPLMKKTGYSGEFAGAVEAAASTGGQIMPPIMGAAAFLMAEVVGISYRDLAVRAILPAVLYFVGVFLIVHLEAHKMGLQGLDKDTLPRLSKLLMRSGYLLLPLAVLVGLILSGYTMSRAAMLATACAIFVSILNNVLAKITKDDSHEHFDANRFFDALENGGRNTLSVAAACGVAGIIACVVTMTGLGQIFISGIVSISSLVPNQTIQLMIGLVLTMCTCILFGMGIPTTATYMIMATTCAPILTTGMGMNVLAANMFVFYFGIVADITPPVALAAYAGSAIAKANPLKTALNASKLAIAAFVVPYIFTLNPAMLFIDTDVLGVVMITLTSLGGMFAISAGMTGYMFTKMNLAQHILIFPFGLMLMYPGTATDIVGALGVVAIVAWQVIQRRVDRKNGKLV